MHQQVWNNSPYYTDHQSKAHKDHDQYYRMPGCSLKNSTKISEHLPCAKNILVSENKPESNAILTMKCLRLCLTIYTIHLQWSSEKRLKLQSYSEHIPQHIFQNSESECPRLPGWTLWFGIMAPNTSSWQEGEDHIIMIQKYQCHSPSNWQMSLWYNLTGPLSTQLLSNMKDNLKANNDDSFPITSASHQS